MSIILIHVLLAVASIIVTGITVFMPTQLRLRLSQVSIALTLASGVVLAVLNHAMILHVCMSGLAYLAIEVVGVVISSRRLAAVKVEA